MGDLFNSCAFCHTFCKSLKKRPSASNRPHFTTKSFTSLNILVGKTSCFLNIQGKEAFEQQFWWILWQIVQSPHEQKTSLILYNSPWTTGLSCIFRSFYHFLTCNIPEHPTYPFRVNNTIFFRKQPTFVLPWLFFFHMDLADPPPFGRSGLKGNVMFWLVSSRKMFSRPPVLPFMWLLGQFRYTVMPSNVKIIIWEAFYCIQ